MKRPRIVIDEDIRRARALPSWVYTDAAAFEVARERIFAASWHLAPDTDRVKVPGQVCPFPLLEGLLEEPLLLTRDADDRIHCVSNVCTHRANLVVDGPGVEAQLRCRYHGRRFGLDGRLLSMPEFDGVLGFPSPADNLKPLAFERWHKFTFASLQPAFSFEELTREMRERCGWLPIGDAVFDPARSRDYLVRAHWALYCDNYLEGFHIPYVHAALTEALDYSAYRVELFPYSSLQVGIARGGDDAFAPPPSSPDHGQRIAAYYFWLFPNLMFNFYPWGVSINIVKPLAPDRTKVTFLSYVWDASRLGQGASAELDRVEREDESVVESVQKGVASRSYAGGRYSPAQEPGVHHFHRLLARFLDEPAVG